MNKTIVTTFFLFIFKRAIVTALFFVMPTLAAAGTPPAEFTKRLAAASHQQPTTPEGDFELGGSNGEYAKLITQRNDLVSTYKLEAAPLENKLASVVTQARTAGCSRYEMEEEVPDGCTAVVENLRLARIAAIGKKARYYDEAAKLHGQMGTLEERGIRDAARAPLYDGASSATSVCTGKYLSDAIMAHCKQLQTLQRHRSQSSSPLGNRDLGIVLVAEAEALRALAQDLQSLRGKGAFKIDESSLPEMASAPLMASPSDAYDLKQ